MFWAAFTSRSWISPQAEHSPLSYSKACDTSRPLRREYPRRRAGLGREGRNFIYFLKHTPVPAGLVAEGVSGH